MTDTQPTVTAERKQSALWGHTHMVSDSKGQSVTINESMLSRSVNIVCADATGKLIESAYKEDKPAKLALESTRTILGALANANYGDQKYAIVDLTGIITTHGKVTEKREFEVIGMTPVDVFCASPVGNAIKNFKPAKDDRFNPFRF